MRLGISARLLAVGLMLTLFGGARAIGAQEGSGDDQYGVGLYLGDCGSLEPGAALFDLGDAELATEEFESADENAEGEGEGEGDDLESELEEESSGDETDVESAIGDEGEGDGGEEGDDQEVVVQGDDRAVYASTDVSFDGTVEELVDAPFAVAVRQGADDDTTSAGDDGEGEEFVACGEFGGAVAGDEIIIPLDPLDGSSLSGFAILSTGDGESVASIYLAGEEGEGGGDDSDSEDDSTEGGEDEAEGDDGAAEDESEDEDSSAAEEAVEGEGDTEGDDAEGDDAAEGDDGGAAEEEDAEATEETGAEATEETGAEAEGDATGEGDALATAAAGGDAADEPTTVP